MIENMDIVILAYITNPVCSFYFSIRFSEVRNGVNKMKDFCLIKKKCLQLANWPQFPAPTIIPSTTDSIKCPIHRILYRKKNIQFTSSVLGAGGSYTFFSFMFMCSVLYILQGWLFKHSFWLIAVYPRFSSLRRLMEIDYRVPIPIIPHTLFWT